MSKLGSFFGRGPYPLTQSASVSPVPGEPRPRGGGDPRRLAAPPLLALAIWVAFALSGVTAASAAETHPYETSFGSFQNVQGLAVDQADGSLYVLDPWAGRVSRFDAGHGPAPFSATAPYIEGNELTGTADGAFALSIGNAETQLTVAPPGAPGGTAGNLYVTENSGLAIFAPGGEYLGKLDGSGNQNPSTGGQLCGVAVDPAGSIYLGYFSGHVDKYVPSANPPLNSDFDSALTGLGGICNVAASTTRLFASTWNQGPVTAYPLTAFPGGGAEAPAPTGTVIEAGGSPVPSSAVATDLSDQDLYVNERNRLGQFSEQGELVGRSDADALGEESTAIAVDSSGTSSDGSVYAGGFGQVHVFGAPVPLADAETGSATAITETSASLGGMVTPAGVAVESCAFEYGEDESYGSVAPCTETSAEIGSGTAPVPVTADLSGLLPGRLYHYRLAVSGPNGDSVGEDRNFVTFSPPEIVDARVASVGFEEAVLRLTINPRAGATTYYVEYGETESYGSSTPSSQVGADMTDHSLTAFLNGLTPATTYHWRVVATNATGTTHSSDGVFTTATSSAPAETCPNAALRGAASADLSNCRAYEMVSPVDKQGSDIFSRISENDWPTAFTQSSPDGSAMTYSSYRSFAGNMGAPYTSQYLARRVPDSGWQTKGIDAIRTTTAVGLETEAEYRAFLPDLSSGWIIHSSGPALDPCAPEGFRNLYRHGLIGDQGFEGLTCVEPTTSPGSFYPQLQGISANGERAIFIANDALTPDASNAQSLEIPRRPISQIYAVDGLGNLHLVSVMPDGEASELDSAVGTSPVYELAVRSQNSRFPHVETAVSSDGERVYWTATGEGFKNSIGPIYLRQNATSEPSSTGSCEESGQACTIPVSGTVTPGAARFQLASPDGGRALFTVDQDPGEQSESSNLYLFDAEAEPPESTLIAEGVQRLLLGASKDLSYFYFVSIDASAEAQAEGAVLGAPNIFVYHEGESRFVATLSVGPRSESDFENFYGTASGSAEDIPREVERNARVSSDGRFLAFMSNSPQLSQQVGGIDNMDSVSGTPNAQVYLYEVDDAGGSGHLTCVSCKPDGSALVGRKIGRGVVTTGALGYWASAALPTYQNIFHQPRFLAEDGSRVYFNSFEALVPRDTNGKADVYQWEAVGDRPSGCSEGSVSYSERNHGCLTLISTGQSSRDSQFLDATPTGSDVFFTTAESLVPQDPQFVDVYDARELGGFPPSAVSPPGCEGESCQQPSGTPALRVPGTATFVGPGNRKPRCGKGKVRRQGKCVKKGRRHRGHKGQKKTAHHLEERASQDRRAGK